MSTVKQYETYLTLCLQKLDKTQQEIDSIMGSLTNESHEIINSYITMAHTKHFYYLLDEFEYDLIDNKNVNYKLEDFIVCTDPRYKLVKYMFGQQFLTSSGKMVKMIPVVLPYGFIKWGFEELKKQPIRIANVK